MTRPEPDTRPVFRTAPGEYRQLIERWLAPPTLRDLVENAGASWPAGDLSAVVDELERFSAGWDFRGGQSRLVFHDASESRTGQRAQLVYQAARDLGLLDSPAPTMAKPDHLLILGGLATGVEPRVRYAADLLDRGTLTTDRIAALGSFRPLDEREHHVASHYAGGARNEIELLAAMTSVLGADDDWAITTDGDPDVDPARAQEVRRWRGEPQITIYAARSSQSNRRPANTIDTYLQFASDVSLHEGQELLIITSTIYRPYQHLDALRALGPYGITIETVGVPSSPHTGPTHPPSAYLQELRSTIRSTRALLAAAQDG